MTWSSANNSVDSCWFFERWNVSTFSFFEYLPSSYSLMKMCRNVCVKILWYGVHVFCVLFEPLSCFALWLRTVCLSIRSAERTVQILVCLMTFYAFSFLCPFSVIWPLLSLWCRLRKTRPNSWWEPDTSANAGARRTSRAKAHSPRTLWKRHLTRSRRICSSVPPAAVPTAHWSVSAETLRNST